MEAELRALAWAFRRESVSLGSHFAIAKADAARRLREVLDGPPCGTTEYRHRFIHGEYEVCVVQHRAGWRWSADRWPDGTCLDGDDVFDSPESAAKKACDVIDALD